MTKRSLWLVAYDVRAPGRLRDVLEIVKGWSTGGQRSVHECWLSGTELTALRFALASVLAPEEDSIVLIAPDPSRAARTLGLGKRPRDPRFVLIV